MSIPNVLNPPVFPLGMEYIAEYLLKKNKHQVSILDMNVSNEVESMVAGQDLVLMGVRNLDSGMDNEDFELQKTLEIVKRFKEVYQA